MAQRKNPFHGGDAPLSVIEQKDHFVVELTHKAILDDSQAEGRFSLVPADLVTPELLLPATDPCFHLPTPRLEDVDPALLDKHHEFVATLGEWGLLLQVKYRALLDRLEHEQAQRPFNGAALKRPFVLEETGHIQDENVAVPVIMTGNERSIIL